MNINKIRLNNISRSKSAIIAGGGILIMAIIAPIANFYILDGIIRSDNLSETLENIILYESQFRLSIVLNLIVVILDLIVAWALYIFLYPLNKNLSLLAALFRIVYLILFSVSLFYLIEITQLIIDENLDTQFVQSMIDLSFKNFFLSWFFALILFGFHLLIIGYLILKARYMKKILGLLLIIASMGYLIDGLGKVLCVDYQIEITLYTFVGEIALMVWLLFTGWKMNTYNE